MILGIIAMRNALPYVALVLLVAGCSYVPSIPFFGPHKIDVQQGNYVTQDMVDKLKPGMSRSQVRFALGTPLIADPFHADRWDYVYVYEHKGRVIGQRRIVVVFKDDALVRIEGDVVPRAAKEGDAAPAKGAAAPAQPSPPTAATGGPAR
jgi:outer membrane protein assembly factor BamE